MYGATQDAALEVPLQKHDRVIVLHDGAMTRGRVMSTVADIEVGVSFEKGGEVFNYKRAEVFPLYRWSDGKSGGIKQLLFPLSLSQ